MTDPLSDHPTDPLRIAIVPCGFDLDEFAPMDCRLARERLGLDPRDFVVPQLGRIVPRKAVDNVIRALGLLGRREAAAGIEFADGCRADARRVPRRSTDGCLADAMNRRLRILTWHVHGNYLDHLSQVAADFYLVMDAARSEHHTGCSGSLPWEDNVHDAPTTARVHSKSGPASDPEVSRASRGGDRRRRRRAARSSTLSAGCTAS